MSNPTANNDEDENITTTTTTTTTTTSSLISSPKNHNRNHNEFHILTTLQYHFFNEEDEDARAEANPPIDTPSNLINTWKTLNATLLGLHARRILDAATALRWTAVLDMHLNLGPLIEQAARAQLFRPHGTTEPPDRGVMVSARVRVLVSEAAVVTIEVVPLGAAAAPLAPILRARIGNYTTNPFEKATSPSAAEMKVPSRVMVDSRPTLPSVFTRHKTTCRQAYDEARGRADPPLRPTTMPTDCEVLLFNSGGEIMEASMSSVYFLREGEGMWVTPRLEAGGMQSVTRTYALGKGWCVEAAVMKESIRDGEVVWLSNAVRGFFSGRIHLAGQAGLG
ncbi:hypothetical protein A1O7_04457 [Cladophialophora yegresii CBS 114405]|uniref:Uncharacterized protein n=1 Tax=Cladophialophora yegresii CBS 114405 TaxID=1182544 RepID=W9W5L5_9EURO|nr:uncharacterized protein A1O7_04457 [Cladophialophora yegresii CBS 114405]EXJ60305.1 hypothetical protein A1O7_04457 [Cladophialophora yegresii CBS 114405]